MTRPTAFRALPFVALLLSACAATDRGAAPLTAPATPVAAPAPADPAAQARTVAARLNERAAVLAESGLELRSATAQGQNVTAEFGLAFPAADLSDADRAEVGPTFTNALLEGFCADENARGFFAAGNTMRVRFVGSDEAEIADVVLSTCP